MNKTIKKLVRLLPDELIFGESYRLAKKTNYLFNESKDKIDFVYSYQEEKLKALFKIASTAPHYYYLSADSNINNLPFIDKEVIAASFDNLIVSKHKADYITTGGTSGKPLGFYIDKRRKGFEWYWMTNNWSKAGFKMNEFRAVLRNHKLKGKIYRVDPLLLEYQYNNFSLTEDYLDIVVDHINSKGIKFLHAYPSAAYTLAGFLQRQQRKTTLKTFLCGSETVFPYQKDLIQNTLEIRMYTWYGMSEKVILAGENEHCEYYHANPFYGYTELIDEDGAPVSVPGKSGELTGTAYINTNMPFIRYKTGDYAELVGEVCPQCGHIGCTFKNVQGRRIGDKIYKSDKSFITTTALNLHDDIYTYIKGLQYFQDKIGIVEVRVIPDRAFNSNIMQKFLAELHSRAGDGLEIRIVEVDSFELSVNNKFQLLVQKIKQEQL